MPRSFVNRMLEPQFELAGRYAQWPKSPPIIAVTRGVAAGQEATFEYTSHDLGLAAPARNVVAMIEGSDARLKSEFVVLSAHADGLGVAALDLRAGADSVYHGADDGGTGSIALLAIAQHIAEMPVKPKRSIVFVWTVAEEQGFLGAEYFSDHPTVSRGRIVANITVDGIGRGTTNDLQTTGAHRLSSEFSKWIDTVNERAGSNFHVEDPAPSDTAHFHATCDGDDWHFARWAIPSVRISAGRSTDFHQVTDDVAKIDFEKYTRVTEFIAALAVDAANRAIRARVDKEKPDPRTACVR
jgi:Zn-dependent M28 family amino/carboxypeptidase